MFDIGWSELVVIGIIALVVVGPKDLPQALRTLGRMVGQVKRMAGDFQGHFNAALREAELDGLRRELDELKRGATSHLDVGSDIQRSLDTPAMPKAKEQNAAERKIAGPRPSDLPAPTAPGAETHFDEGTKT